MMALLVPTTTSESTYWYNHNHIPRPKKEHAPSAGLTPLLVPTTSCARELPGFTAAESYSYLFLFGEVKRENGRGSVGGLDLRCGWGSMDQSSSQSNTHTGTRRSVRT